MNRRTLVFVLIFALCLVVTMTLPQAYVYAEAATDESAHSEVESGYSVLEMVIYYSLAVLSLVVGIPVLIALKKRAKRDLSQYLEKQIDKNHAYTLQTFKQWQQGGRCPYRKLLNATVRIGNNKENAKNLYFDRRVATFSAIEKTLEKYNDCLEQAMRSGSSADIDKSIERLESLHGDIEVYFNQYSESSSQLNRISGKAD